MNPIDHIVMIAARFRGREEAPPDLSLPTGAGFRLSEEEDLEAGDMVRLAWYVRVDDPAGSHKPSTSVGPIDRIDLIGVRLDAGDEPPVDLAIPGGRLYRLGEVEDLGGGDRMAWYVREQDASPDSER